MHTKEIKWFGFAAVLACDGLCEKAYGINNRPKVSLSEDEDDFAWLSDGELVDAPIDPGTYEGGCAKPTDPSGKNKWCARECERSVVADPGHPITLPDFSRRCFNQRWKHETPNC